MLDYNTIEVINSNIGIFPPSKTFIVWIVIAAILIVFSATVYFGSSGAILGLVFAVVFSLVSFYCGKIKKKTPIFYKWGMNFFKYNMLPFQPSYGII